MDPIGEWHSERLACGTEHLPGCYNPNCDQTWCICGQVQWPGQVGTWHSVPRYAPAPPMPSLGIGVGAVGMKEPETEFFGWDTYYFHAPQCARRSNGEPCAPHC